MLVMRLLRLLLPLPPSPSFIVAFAVLLTVAGTYLALLSTVLFRAGERLQARMAKNRKNRQSAALRMIWGNTLWQKRHPGWQTALRFITGAIGIFLAVEGLEMLLA